RRSIVTTRLASRTRGTMTCEYAERRHIGEAHCPQRYDEEPASSLSQPRPQTSERREHLRVREVRVAAAGVRQDEHARAFECVGLKTETNRFARPFAKHDAKERDADERHHARLPPPHFPPKRHAVRKQLTICNSQLTKGFDELAVQRRTDAL